MAPDGLNNESTTTKPAKPEKKRDRASRAAEPTGAVHPREMTKFRDRIGAVRDKAVQMVAEDGQDPQTEFLRDLNQLYTDFDRIDLRFKVYYDPSTKKKAK